MNNLSIYSTIDRSFKHYNLYQFWSRSQGLWLSKLTKVTLRLLDELELQAFSQIQPLAQPEFGVKMAWEYQTKAEVGQMSWCVDAAQPGLVFTNKSVTADSPPAIYGYRMVDDHILVTAADAIEERTAFESDSQRLRELRCEGKLLRRFWENRFNA
jgi:hypothetical protein